MTDIYIVTMGEYSDYSIISVWSSKEEAERNCKMLNAGKVSEDFRVEEYPLDEPRRNHIPMIRGFKAFYDFSVHGLHVDTANVAFEDALYYSFQDSRVHIASTFVSVLSDSKERCLRILFDAMAEYRANEEGIVT